MISISHIGEAAPSQLLQAEQGRGADPCFRQENRQFAILQRDLLAGSLRAAVFPLLFLFRITSYTVLLVEIKGNQGRCGLNQGVQHCVRRFCKCLHEPSFLCQRLSFAARQPALPCFIDKLTETRN